MPIDSNIDIDNNQIPRAIEKQVYQALQEIKKGVVEIIDENHIKRLLVKYYTDKTTYLVKAGFDPTATDLHLGHTVLLQKLATFQQYGGHVQFLIGDFTAMIGDPTGKNETRKVLDTPTILHNAKSYQQQVFKILDANKTTIYFNSEWLQGLGADGMLSLTTQFTVARMLERDDFTKRFEAQTPIAISEFLYPLLQGYDSVHLDSDIEIGGTDQKFNLLMGRHLQRAYQKNKQQSILMMPILEGLDGIQKMSKSLNNFIAIKEEANTMFAKIMSISDDLMWIYYDLISAKHTEQIKVLKEGVDSSNLHPKKVKEQLAEEIVDRFHPQIKEGKTQGELAQIEFNRVFSAKNLPTDMPTATITIEEESIWLLKVLKEQNLISSTSEGKRLIAQEAIKIDNNKVNDDGLMLLKGKYSIKVGKKKFLQLEIL